MWRETMMMVQRAHFWGDEPDQERAQARRKEGSDGGVPNDDEETVIKYGHSSEKVFLTEVGCREEKVIVIVIELFRREAGEGVRLDGTE